MKPVLSMSEHKAQAAQRKGQKKRKPIPKKGPRGVEYTAWERKERAKRTRCDYCRSYMDEFAPARHLIPRSIAPSLQMTLANVRWFCLRCEERYPQNQNEDAMGVKGNLEKRAKVIRGLYGMWDREAGLIAEIYVRQNWPGRRA